MDPSDSLSRSPHQGGGRPEPSAADLARQLAELSQQMAETQRLLQDPRDQKTVGEIVAVYLEHLWTEDLSPHTVDDRDRALTGFAREYGTLRIGECTPLHLLRWLQGQPQWQSPHTRHRVCVSVQRCFNFAVEMRLIRENPFKGIYFPPGEPGRALTDQEFRTLARLSFLRFRQLLFALRWTGARPCELRTLRWTDIDWNQGLAILDQHKTRKKTGKPRVIVLTAPALKLLRWIYRNGRDPAAVLLFRLLERGPRRIREVVRAMKAKGYSYRSIYKARQAIGATCRRVGGYAGDGYVIYELPHQNTEEFRTAARTAERRKAGESFVFVNSRGQVWTRHALARQFRRLCTKAGLDPSCRAYGCRHLFGTQAVKSGLNLKVVATLMGHTSVRTTEQNYVHIDGDVDFLREAAQQIQKGSR